MRTLSLIKFHPQNYYGDSQYTNSWTLVKLQSSKTVYWTMESAWICNLLIRGVPCGEVGTGVWCATPPDCSKNWSVKQKCCSRKTGLVCDYWGDFDYCNSIAIVGSTVLLQYYCDSCDTTSPCLFGLWITTASPQHTGVQCPLGLQLINLTGNSCWQYIHVYLSF